jgi:hypothetical protein
MRTIHTETTVYSFDELPEDVQEKAIQNLWDINVDFEWWNYTYEDAERIGLKITEFDLDRQRYAKGSFLCSPFECAELITKEHGESTSTYQTAKQFLAEREDLVLKYSCADDPCRVHEDNEYEFDNECDELDNEFLRSLCEDYSILLQKEYEYLTSEKAIKETIEANEYEFTIDGKIF